MRRMKAETGKPLWAIADHSALSAGYALARAADKLYLPRTGEVGSIGVVAAHVDQSGYDAKQGVQVTYVYAGAHKVDGNPHQPLPPAVKEALQADIDALYSAFVSDVAAARNISEDAVRATEARIYRGQDAIAAGLADAIGTLPEALAAMAATLVTPPTSNTKGNAAMADPNEQTTAADLKTSAAENEARTRAAVEAATKAATDRAAKITEIATQANRLGVKVDAAASIADAAVTPEGLQARVLREAAEAADASHVSSSRAIPADSAKAGAGWDAAFNLKN
jgi:ClpP class serine protease